MRKVHLQANAGIRMAPFSYCASRVNGKGNVEFNGRRSYAYMASDIVRLEQFKATPEARRCAHCCDVLLQRRNARRRKEGLEPSAAYNEGWPQ